MTPPHILLVEDNPGDVELLREAFRTTGWNHRLWLAGDGLEALAFLHARSPLPDLMLLDLNLPNLNGIEILARMRGDAVLGSIPVVVLSGSEWDRNLLQGLGVQEDRYLVKPVRFLDYLGIARRIEEIWTGCTC